MVSLWPNIFLTYATDALRWAHCICSCCCLWLRFGSLLFRQMLSMPQGGPIAFSAAPADGFALAHYFSSGCYRCPRIGPLHLHQLLPMVSLGPFTFSRGIANALGWAYHIGAADAPEWAHHNSCCCWPRHRSGPLFFWQMLPMP